MALVERCRVDVGGGGRPDPDGRRVVRGAGTAALSPTRFAVAGGPGSGKTTVAAELARRLGLDHVELDGLWWDPGWREAGPDALQARVRDRLAAAVDGWVVDGNYLDQVARTLVWPAAEVLVWLDLPRPIAYRRAVTRTARRVLDRRPMWNGNRETIRNLGPANLARVWRRWPAYGERVAALVEKLGDAGPDVVRLRSDAEVRTWLDYVSAA